MVENYYQYESTPHKKTTRQTIKCRLANLKKNSQMNEKPIYPDENQYSHESFKDYYRTGKGDVMTIPGILITFEIALLNHSQEHRRIHKKAILK